MVKLVIVNVFSLFHRHSFTYLPHQLLLDSPHNSFFVNDGCFWSLTLRATDFSDIVPPSSMKIPNFEEHGLKLYHHLRLASLRLFTSLGHSTVFPGDISTLLTLTLLGALPVLILANVTIYTNDPWNTPCPPSKCLVLHPDLRHLFLWSQHGPIITNNCQAYINYISSVPLSDTCLLLAYSLKYTNFNSTVTII